MKIRFLGHSSFLITSEKGVRIITDPYKAGCFGGGIKYAPINEEADIVTISHEHDDHNSTDISGKPTFVRGVGAKQLKGIEISGFEVFHDECGGAERGQNTVFKMSIDGVSVVHLGDIGHQLSDEEIQLIGKVDILFIPVGGYFTIDATTAESIAAKLMPRIIVPMHFKTEGCGFPIAPVDDYIKNKEVKKCDGEFEISKENLPDKMMTYVLNPTK
jgi:L-ascorbate metabolism protein UlaG (beta-lactamase superfamily)